MGGLFLGPSLRPELGPPASCHSGGLIVVGEGLCHSVCGGSHHSWGSSVTDGQCSSICEKLYSYITGAFRPPPPRLVNAESMYSCGDCKPHGGTACLREQLCRWGHPVPCPTASLHILCGHCIVLRSPRLEPLMQGRPTLGPGTEPAARPAPRCANLAPRSLRYS